MRRTGTPDDLVMRPGPLAIILALLHRGPMTRQELAEVVGVQSGTIRYHVYAMLDAGLLTTLETDGAQRHDVADRRAMERRLDRLRPNWRDGGIPRGRLWREVQAAIDTRRIRGNYRTRIPFRSGGASILPPKRKL